MSSVLLLLAGLACLALVAVDALRTVVAPSARGPLSLAAYLAAWRLARAMPRRARERALRIAGPASILVSLAAWLGLLWLGFALVYLPFLDDFSFSPDVRFGERGLWEALYISGTAVTTVGFGDVNAETDALRMLTVLEAATGLAIFTAAISYLPAIYTLVSELRASARSVADLRGHDPRVAADLAVHGGTQTIALVQRDLVATRQHFLRFPVLHFFHPPPEASPLVLLRGATGLCVVVRWGIDPDRLPHARAWGAALEEALRHLLQDTARQIPGTVSPGIAEDGEQRVTTAREAVAAIDPGLAASGPVPEAATELLALADAVLDAYAHMHDYDSGRLRWRGA